MLELMAQGCTNAGVAAKLVVSEGTVKQHVKHILRKLRAGNRAEAVSRPLRVGGRLSRSVHTVAKNGTVPADSHTNATSM